MCISVSLSGSVVLGCLFAPKVHIILFQPQKNVASLRVTTSRFSATVSASASAPCSSYSKGICVHYSCCSLVFKQKLRFLKYQREGRDQADLHEVLEILYYL